MKARIKIIAMLMTISIGTLAASAQSAQRGTPHSKQDRKSSSNVTTRQHTSAREQGQRVTENRQTPPKVSTTNNNNPRSNYRTADRTVEVNKTYLNPKQRSGKVRYTNESRSHATETYANNHKNTNSRSHYYYPQKRVKIRVHPTTYHNHYRAMYYPANREIIWTRHMHNYYVGIYPGYTWRYPVGYRIQTISAFDARYNVGEVERVYGRVYGTWFNRDTDDLLLFFGGEFPNQEFTMVVPGSIARRFSWNPEKYFLGQHVISTGLITTFDGSPEMIIKRRKQLEVY